MERTTKSFPSSQWISRFSWGDGIHFNFYNLADFFSSTFGILQANQHIIIGNTEKERTAAAICKSTDAFQPAPGLLFFQSLFLIISGCFAKPISNFHSLTSFSNRIPAEAVKVKGIISVQKLQMNINDF